MAKRGLFHSFHTPHFIQKSWLETGRFPFQLEEQVEEKIPHSVGACQPSKQPACWLPGASVNIHVSLHPTVVTQPGLALLWWWACPFRSSKGFLGVEGGYADDRQGRFHSQQRTEHSCFYQEWWVKMQLLSQEAHWGSQKVKYMGFHIRGKRVRRAVRKPGGR